MLQPRVSAAQVGDVMHNELKVTPACFVQAHPCAALGGGHLFRGVLHRIPGHLHGSHQLQLVHVRHGG